MLMSGHTIEGVIKRENKHDVTPGEMKILIIAFNHLNGKMVPKMGIPTKIPILQRHIDVI